MPTKGWFFDHEHIGKPNRSYANSTVHGNCRFFNLKRFIMQQYSKNPRKITDAQLEQLKSNIKELGDLSGIVHDLNTDEIISGNQRSKVININECEIEIVKKYDEPNEQGTVAYGFVIFENQRLNYRQVRWNEKQREKACITANSLGGEFDYDILLENWDITELENWGIKDLENKIESEDKEKKEIKDLSEQLKPTYKLEIECSNESELQSLYEEISERGLLCRILTL